MPITPVGIHTTNVFTCMYKDYVKACSGDVVYNSKDWKQMSISRGLFK